MWPINLTLLLSTAGRMFLSSLTLPYFFISHTNGPIDFFILRPTRCTKLVNLFSHEALHVSDSASVHHQEFIHCTSRNDIYVIEVCRQLTSRIRLELWVYSEWTLDDGQRHCPKHVEFQGKNKFVKLVHLADLIIKTFITIHGHMKVKLVLLILTFNLSG
jgi:hypothetical protein